MPWLLLALLLGHQSPAPAALVAVAIDDPSAFARAVGACTPATFGMPHPLMRNFTVAHQVEGERDGLCHYSQTMPGDMRMECGFDQAGREAYAAEFVEMAAGRLAGSSNDKPVWADACETVMKDGKRIPAFGG